MAKSGGGKMETKKKAAEMSKRDIFYFKEKKAF